MLRYFLLLFSVIALACGQICDPVCKNGGQCLQGAVTNSCKCVPNSGWTGQTCEVAICTTPCKFGGVCVAPNVCDCPLGYSGADCSKPNCTLPCLNNGTCIAKDTCDCSKVPFTGAQCQLPVCDPTCKAGVCSAPNTCDCAGTGFVGKLCDTPTCNPPCAHGTCGPSPNACDCTGTDYIGALCEIPVCTPPCENAGICTPGNICDCSALVGWTGSRCDTAICGAINCTHLGKCSGPDTCDCSGTGWAGETCDVDINECTATTSPCDPLAPVCVNSQGNYTCSGSNGVVGCPAGYSGDGKTKNGGCVDIDECAAGGFCDPLVQCTNSPGSFSCGKCPPGFGGSGLASQGGCKGSGGGSASSGKTWGISILVMTVGFALVGWM